MDSTFSVAKTARAIQADDGNIYYALIESTFESNVFPQTPHASCIFLGTLDDCMGRILHHAAACEGGMLKGASGDILPESYIRQWRRALATVIGRPNFDETARVRFGDGIYVVADELRSTFKAVFGKHGHAFDERADESSFSLRTHAPAVAELVRDHGVYPWRLIEPQIAGCKWDEDLSAVFPQKPVKPAITASAWRLPKDANDASPGSDDEHFIVNGDRARATGWRYSTVGTFITEVVVHAERRHPGCAENLIRRFRASTMNAPRLASTATVRLRRPADDAINKWRIEQFERLLAKLRTDPAPALFAWDEAERTLDTPLGDIERLDSLRILQSIQSAGLGIEVVSLIPEADREPAGVHALA